MRRQGIWLGLWMGLLVGGCSHVGLGGGGQSTATQIVEEVSRRFYFDARQWYLNLTVAGGPEGLVLSGESFTPHAVRAVVRQLERAGYAVAADSVTYLPDTLAGEGNYGVVTVRRVMSRFTAGAERQEATELVYGDPVRVVRGAGPHLQVQSPTGYLGYVPADSLRRMDLDEWERYHRGPSAVFPDEAELAQGQTVPMGTRLPLVAPGRVLLPDGSERRAPDSRYRVSDPAASPLRLDVIEAARQYLGLPYVWGGRSDRGVDCSGLVQQAYAACGVYLPRDSDQMANAGRLVGLPGWRTALLPGDLVFFTGSRRLVIHVGLYAGDGMVVHARGRGVQVQSWEPSSPEYDESLDRDFVFAKRIFD